MFSAPLTDGRFFPNSTLNSRENVQLVKGPIGRLDCWWELAREPDLGLT